MRAWASPTSALCSGIGRGSGAPALSHSSVQALRSILAGLPVSDRERTVSLDVAARNFSLTAGCVSASSVVSHTDPHHTPSAPSAIAAAICRPLPIPPAASTGVGATASTTSGTSTIVAMSPVWPPASVPWATMRSTPACLCRSAWTRLPASAATTTSWPWATSMSDEEGAVVARRDVHPTPAPDQVAYVVGELGDVVAAEDVVDELLVLRRQELADRLTVEAPLVGAGVLHREEEVDAVGSAPHLLLDPAEVDLELLRGVCDRSQHTEAACIRDGGDDVTAVAERQDRELDPEDVADPGPHGKPLRIASTRTLLRPLHG